MKLSASREELLKPLQAVIGVVERKQTMPILANVLLVAEGDYLTVTATDLEVELVAKGELEKLDVPGQITVPGRKLFDICKALPSQSEVKLSLTGERLTVQSGRSKFVLSTLSATDFPVVDEIDGSLVIRVSQNALHHLLEKTNFCMAQQDVRYYLNGLLFETDGAVLRGVATDGHRLALCEIDLDGESPLKQQVIVPRKGVLELQRLLAEEGEVEIAIGTNHIRAELGDIRFTSKLIDGRFPDYSRVVPELTDTPILGNRDMIRQALQRAAILSNEKYRGVRLELLEGQIKIEANNPDQETAQDEVEVDYTGMSMEIGFNVNYLMDALAAVDSEQVELNLSDPNSSCLIRVPGIDSTKYVVMPMRL
ncbi:MAG: DNA polymerase III subunit beta [Gammaproteobacteria bacterium]|nr:DNA polymerase III subunit beta [Gammaproteobacteria bacterium]